MFVPNVVIIPTVFDDAKWGSTIDTEGCIACAGDRVVRSPIRFCGIPMDDDTIFVSFGWVTVGIPCVGVADCKNGMNL